MRGYSLTVMNILFSYAANILLLLVYQLPERKSRVEYYHKKYEQQLKQTTKLKQQLTNISSKNFTVKLRSIEDKCKAINFVIGRVYSTKHKGNKTIRETLKIPRELYDRFSEMEKKGLADPKLLNQILNKLINLEHTESQAIGKRILSKNHEPIIQILKENDKDPVEDYHREAKEVCQALIQYLKGGK